MAQLSALLSQPTVFVRPCPEQLRAPEARHVGGARLHAPAISKGRRGYLVVSNTLAGGRKSVSRSTNVFDLLDAEIFGDKNDDVSGKLEEWIGKLGRSAKAAKAQAKASCCYCGAEADMEPQPCTLSCSCDWEMAHDVWVTNVDKSLNQPEEYEENMVYVEQLFTKAMEGDEEKNNVLLVADFALFLWKQKGDLRAVEDMLNKALAMKKVSTEKRAIVLNLYSFFLSSTPPASSNSGLSDYRKSYSTAQ